MGTWKKLVQRSWPDYLCAVAMIIIIVVIRNVSSPARRLLDQLVASKCCHTLNSHTDPVLQNMLEDLGYPIKEKFIPDAVNGTLTWMIPVALMAIAGVCGRFSAFRTHEHCVSFFISHVLSALITIGLRRLIGRPRPDFLQRCFEGVVPTDFSPQTIEANFITSPRTTSLEPVCTGNEDTVDFGYTSFPSTQGALATAGGLYVTLFLIHLWGVFGNGRSFQALMSLVPLTFGTWLSVITFIDYSHHAADVIAGMAIGAASSSYFFFQAQRAEEGAIEPLDTPEELAARSEDRAHGDDGAGAGASSAPAASGNGAVPESGVQMRDMYAAVEIARAGKQNPFA